MTMIEKAAAAIRDSENCGLNINGRRAFCDDPEAEERPAYPCSCRSSAHAAISAIREPNEAMIEAGVGAMVDSSCPVTPGWQACIDSILKEGT